MITKKNLKEMNERYRINFINSIHGAKAANLIGTYGKEGPNLAIFSSIFHLGANPPLVGLVSRPNTVPRHTLENIKETKLYTINQVNSQIIENSHQTSSRSDKELNEFINSKLSEQYTELSNNIPYVQESNIKFLLKLIKVMPVIENDTEIIIGEIQEVLIDKNIITEDGTIDSKQADSIVVTGLDTYHELSEGVKLTYAKKDSWPKLTNS